MPLYGGATRGITTGTVLQISNLSDTVTRTDIVVSGRHCVWCHVTCPCGMTSSFHFALCRTSVRRVALSSRWSCWGVVWLRWSSSQRMMHRKLTGGTTGGTSMVRVSTC